ncbi:MAG: VWA domain-containing protein [Anaerolineae bacterium]
MNIDFDPYVILGVSPDASFDEIKEAHRRAVRRLHSDTNPHKGAIAQLQDINVAYKLLSEPDRREQYNQRSKRKKPREFEFLLRVTPSKRTIAPLSEPQVVYMLVEIIPDPRAREQEDKLQKQSRLNLTLVLDRSNSMNGVRLERVKVAAHQIIDQLNQDDVFSVVTFNDYPEVLIPATSVHDKAALKAHISMMAAGGGTEIYKGLAAGVEQNRQYLAPKLVNHIILLTDGNTYGDQERCVALAKKASTEGIIISAMGLGSDWNDKFLDEVASVSGGACEYIKSPGSVVRFLNDHVRSLVNVFVERLQLSVAPDADVRLETAFKLAPNSQPLSVDEAAIPLGNLQVNRLTSVLLQFELPANMPESFRTVARIMARGDILANEDPRYQALSDFSIGVSKDAEPEETPPPLLDALGKLTLYRLQERAQEALENGDIQEATRRLENLATRLLERGEEELAMQARTEAQQVAYTSALSDKGRKALKFQTRSLLLASGGSPEEQYG